MIREFVDMWEARKNKLKLKYYHNYPASYDEIVQDVIELFCVNLDQSKIHIIDDGDFQGTRLYIIPEKCYQPSHYYSIFVDYGSCSGCDTFEKLMEENDEKIILDGLMSLALHMVQDLKLVGNHNID